MLFRSSILNYNAPAGILFNSTDKTLTASFPVLNIIKPCVVRGTEIVRYAVGKCEIAKIEDIRVGDMVINQDAKLVRVLEHRCNKILTDSWTAPHIIPTDFFGRGKPYKPLFISGDHGILHDRSNTGSVSRVYPYRLAGTFRRLPVNTQVEYHHLLLEDDKYNFFIANGLAVESLHKGVYSS